MLFSSLPFLYFFLPLFFIFYFLSPHKCKNAVLLLFSLFFYGWGESKYVFLMIAVIIMGYLYGILLEKVRERKSGKYIIFAAVSTYLFILGYFKYADFFIINMRKFLPFELPLLSISLPIGISFYIFQILSYNVDVYRGEVKAQKNLISLGTYISMFPQLIAGPIVRYKDICQQLEYRTYKMETVYDGIRRFLTGLGKKVLVANILGECCTHFKSSDERDLLFFWLYGISFMLHIYFDFSGYSDMAIGLGKVLGFDFMENFQYPYISSSITEFWRRWHISLGTWFRDYVYIPLGGNRVGRGLWIRNILTVWLLTGFWHGASWNFILWGLYFGVLLVIEKFVLLKLLKKIPAVFSHIYALFFIVIGWVIFDFIDLGEMFTFIGNMFSLSNGIISADAKAYVLSYLPLMIVGILVSTPLPRKVFLKLSSMKYGVVLETVTSILVIILSVASLVSNTYNPFLYFRF